MSTALLIDAGNTNTKLCIADEFGLKSSYTLPTRPRNTADDWGFKLIEILRREALNPEDVEMCAVSSVVPPLDPLLSEMSKRFLNVRARFVPRDLPLAIENRYARPEQVGADVLVTALAARRLREERCIIVVDYGTATTLACIVDDAFMGGLICPGVLSSMRSLHEGTAKLPSVELEVASDELSWGRTTSECLNQGLVFGFAEMTSGLCRKLGKQMDDTPYVMATGGLAPGIARVCPEIREVRPDLLMEGLWMACFE
jgi:type III pantothenate kinase